MSVRLADRHAAERETESARRPLGRRQALLALAALLCVYGALAVAGTGPNAERIRHPAPTGTYVYDGVPRADPALWGFEHWGLVIQIGTLVIAAGIWAYFIRVSRRQGAWHPGLVLCCAVTTMLWQDSYSNWVPYAAYDPRLLHWPVTWAWASLSPTVEPLFVIPGYVAAFVPPALGTLWTYHRFVAPKVRLGSWWDRHPVVTLWLVAWLVAMVWDTLVELFFVHTGFYTYTQVIRWGSINAGTTTQLPWLWEVPSVSVIYASATALLWRDDQGQTIADRVGGRVGPFRRRPRLATLVVASCIMNLSFTAYVAFWTPIRLSRVADTVARPWRYQDTKVYDPQGFYHQAGEPGPYFPGIWSGPMQ
jgi:hypothetical protein